MTTALAAISRIYCFRNMGRCRRGMTARWARRRGRSIIEPIRIKEARRRLISCRGCCRWQISNNNKSIIIRTSWGRSVNWWMRWWGTRAEQRPRIWMIATCISRGNSAACQILCSNIWPRMAGCRWVRFISSNKMMEVTMMPSSRGCLDRIWMKICCRDGIGRRRTRVWQLRMSKMAIINQRLRITRRSGCRAGRTRTRGLRWRGCSNQRTDSGRWPCRGTFRIRIAKSIRSLDSRGRMWRLRRIVAIWLLKVQCRLIWVLLMRRLLSCRGRLWNTPKEWHRMIIKIRIKRKINKGNRMPRITRILK